MNILNEIAAKTKERIQKEKLEIPEKDLIQKITDTSSSRTAVHYFQNSSQFFSGSEKRRNVLYL